MDTKRRQSGVTLIELMVGLAIIAIMIGVAVPSWRSAIARDRIAATTNSFINTIRSARSAAQDRQVIVNITANSSTADNEWGQGWQLLDSSLTSPNDLILNFDPIPASIHLDARATDPADTSIALLAVTTITFASNGIRIAPSRSVFTVCDDEDHTIPGRVISVSVLGRVKITDRDFVCS